MFDIDEDFAIKNNERTKTELIGLDKIKDLQRIDRENEAKEKETNHLKMRENLPRAASVLLVLSIISSVLSAIMSVASVSHYYDIYQLSGIFTSIYFLPAIIMLLAQVVAVVLSVVSHAIKQYYKRTSPIVTCVRTFICVISVFTNHGFLCSIIAEYTASQMGVVLGWAFAVVPDLFSFWLSNYSIKLKYRLYENDDEQSEFDNIGVFTKLFENMTFNFCKKINTEWEENQIIKKQEEAERRYRYAQLCEKPLETQTYNVNSKKQRKTKEEICEPYRTKILSIPAGSVVSYITLNLDKKKWRIIRDYFCKDGLLICEGKGKPTKRTDVC